MNRIRLILSFLSIPFFMVSCSNSQNSDLEAKLDETKVMLQKTLEENLELEQKLSLLNSDLAKIDHLEESNNSLKSSLSTLNEDFRSLNSKYNRTVALKEELQEWSMELVEGYGSGIWFFRDGIYPIFHKKIDTNNPKKIIEELNQLLTSKTLPQIIYQGIDNKTVRVGITDDSFLTQEMGSFGPQSYFKAITYSLASLEQVDCVEFDFEEGDHATPGKHCK